jgi:hypothetical protein
MSRFFRVISLSSRKGRIRAAVIAGILAVLAGGGATLSAFTGTTPNAGDAVSSGTVALTDSDSGAMFSLPTLSPNDTDTGCIKVTFSGSLDSEVRLHGTTTGTGLDAFTGLTVTRGSFSPSDPAFDSCTNFVPDATTYITGQAQGVVYTGTLQGFPDNFAGGLVDPTAGSPEVWTTGESHVYKFQVTAADNAAAEGKNATQDFTWEAHNN